MSPVELPYVPILLDETLTKALWDTGAEKSFISEETYQKYFFYKQVKKSSTQVITAQGAKCRNIGVVEINIRIRDFKKLWLFHVCANLVYPCILGIDFIGGSKIILDFDRKSLAIQDSQVEDIKIDDGNLRVDLSETKLNVVANVSNNNRIESIIGEKVNCAIIRDLVLSSRDQLIEEQKTDPELGHIYRYLENPEDSSVNAAICENWSRDFRLVEGLLFYAKYTTSLGEMRVYIPKSLRNEIMREFHDKPLAGHFGRFKTYYKIRDVCYFPYMRKFIDQYVSTCHMCQINNYKNALPAGRLIPIVSNYPNEIVTLDLLGPYPVSRVRRNRYVLVITDNFSKWAEIIPLIKASARVIADNFFNNYISRFGAPIKLISDNGPQFISDIFENLSERLGIRHVKTVVYRPQANRTERVNRDLVQMIANYVNEQHDTWDQFLREFAYAIRTAVNETTGKTLAELFLGRKLITPFQKLVMVSDGTEFAVGDIERLFEETRRNTETKHENWKKYYNRRRRDVQIKVNDWFLVATHPLSSATRKVVAKFKPKFEGPYRVLDVKNNNVVIWKAGKRLTINVDQVRIYRHRKCDETEIGTGNPQIKVVCAMNQVVLTEYNGDQMTREMVKKKGSEGPKRKVQKGSEHRVNKTALSSNYKTNHSLTKYRKKSRREETVMPTTSGYNLRPRIGKREKSRPTIERKAQQGGPVRSRKGRENNDSPYIEERTRSSNKNARRGGHQQRQDQERRGTWTNESLSLEVLIMFDSSSYVDPSPLAHADTSRDVLPRGGTSQAQTSVQRLN
ncbi:retrovirus-related Pol polyprotein from transposon 412 [Trichonephila clavipes]|uniref:RNA-directed DNA polymerase n=1 Tax=Trichonephila clavipes TaxID=2585209 RepID=A0A8X6VC15_TRICX|nr:retrovirus-related Pol polyprotein from transposon 412 [Trichonephila clavipes]